jgi:fructose-1,6-bisphosphatase/inositol monophosphatase family enzyme
MIKESGGIVVDFNGQDIKAGGSIIATNNKLLQKTLEITGNF